MISYNTLKKYKGVISVEDYQLLKKELKLLRIYRQNTKMYSICDSVNIHGDFFIHDDLEDFDYFRKNEYLPKKEEENE